MRLLIKPSPISGESWPGYLIRLSEHNRFDGIAALAKILDMTCIALVSASPTAILKHFGIAAPTDIAPSPTVAVRQRASLYATGRSMLTRLCPKCLHGMEVLHAKSCWDRPLVFVCPTHRILLLEACPACTKPITHLRRTIRSCDCGFHFERAKGKPVDINILHMLELVDLQPAYSVPAPTFGCPGTQELLAYALLSRLIRLDYPPPKRLRTSYGRSDIFLPLATLQKALPWFEQWPEQFIRKTAMNQAASGRPVANLIFGKTSRNAETFPLIKAALGELNHRVQRNLRPKKRCNQVTANDPSNYVGIKFVMNETGSTYDAVRYWISRGWLGDVGTRPMKNGRTEYQIQKKFASKAIHIIKSTGSPSELAKTVGLDARALRVLARNKVLTSIPGGPGAWNVRLIPSEVFDLSAQLMKAASRGLASADRRILVDQAILLVAKNTTFCKPFIDALLAKEIPLRFFGDTPSGPGEISLKADDLSAWRLQIRSRHVT